MNKKIVYVIGGLLRPDGMSQVLSQKINYLAENTDFEMYMILTEKANEPWYYKMSPKIKYVNFDINFDELDTMPFFKKLIFYWKKQHYYKKCFKNYLMSIRPDITITAMRREINFINKINDGSKKIGELHFNKNIYRNFNKPYLPNILNEYITNRWQGKLIKEIKKLDAFIVLTEEDKAMWGNLKNIKVIYNPIKLFPENASTCLNRKVIAVGRYTEQKGFDMLIDAWTIVQAKHPDWLLNIYGSGNNNYYQELAIKKNVGKTIRCNSAVKDIYQKYIDSSIFVLSSRYEGFVLALIEALSCGLPAVAYECPCGPKEVITNDYNGYLVEKNNIHGLANKICLLIEDEENRIRMGINAKRSVVRFKENKIMENWIELFKSL